MSKIKAVFYILITGMFIFKTGNGQPTFKLRIGSQAGTRITIDTVTKIVPVRKMLRFKKAPDVRPLKIVMENDTQRKTIFINEGPLRRKRMWIGMDDTANTLHPNRPALKGLITWNISLLLFNQFYTRIAKEQDRASFGMAGLSAGINYWTKPQCFLSLQAGVMINGVPGERFGDTIGNSRFTNFFVNVKQNRNLRMLDIGYGFSFTHQQWEKYDDIRLVDGVKRFYQEQYSSTGAGLSFSCYYHCTGTLVAGILYQPQLLTYNKNNGIQANYRHTISLDCMVRLTKNKKYMYN